MRVTGVSSGAMNPEATSRRVRHQSHEVRCTTRARWPKRSADASSMKWTSSMVISPVSGSRTANSAMTASASFVRRNSSSSSRVSRVSGTRDRDGHADERGPREELRRPPLQLGDEHGPQLLVAPFGRKIEEPPEQSPHRVIRGRRVVALAHGEQLHPVGGDFAQPARQPGLADAGGPDDLDQRAAGRTSARSPRADASSGPRPTKGSSSSPPPVTSLVLAPRRTARTGLALPFTKNGSSSVDANPVWDRARRSGVV